MSLWTLSKLHGRLRRKQRSRGRIQGTESRPRLNVFRSAKHIYAQVVDDERGITLAQASTLDKSLVCVDLQKQGMASAVGKLIAEKCLSLGIASVVFDRNGFRYHGRVRAVADGARDGGLTV